jgi:hypothetical protein
MLPQTCPDLPNIGHDDWIVICYLREDAKGKDDAGSTCINQINDDLHLLKIDKDY